MQHFKSLLELITFFKSEEVCLKYLEEERWPDNIFCPHCGTTGVYRFSDGKRFKCSACREQFTAKVGTIFEGSKIPLQKWYVAIYFLTAHKKGISSHQLGRDIQVTQKTAWFMLQRIRFAFGIDDTEVDPNDEVQLDETFVGGKNKNRHKDKKVKNSQGRSFKDKTPILGVMKINKEGSIVKCFVISNTRAEEIQPILRSIIPAGTKVISDEWHAYHGLNDTYEHCVVDHGKKEYVNTAGDTTNTLEGFWTWLKRAYTGIYHFMSRKHLQFYADEVAFRYNTRLKTEAERFSQLINSVNCRLTYKTLISR